MKDILIAFVHVFAMMAPWLVFGFLMVGPAMNAMSLTTVAALVGRVPRRYDGLQSGATGGYGQSQVLFKVVRPRGVKGPLCAKEMIQY